MALRQADMVKYFTGAVKFEFAADADESVLVKKFQIIPNAAEEFITVSVDRVSIQPWRIYGFGGNHLSFPTGNFSENMMERLNRLGMNFNIPIGTGQTMTITFANAGTIVVMTYDLYDRDDIRPDMPNGSDSSEFWYLNYMQNSAAIASGATGLIDESMIGNEFPAFPAGVVVPSRYTIEMLGIVASPAALGDSSVNIGCTEYLKLIRDREVLFDTDRNGLLFLGDITIVAAAVDYGYIAGVIGCGTDTHAEPPLIFSEPLRFAPGEELNIYLTDGGAGGAGFGANEIEIAPILHATRTGI